MKVVIVGIEEHYCLTRGAMTADGVRRSEFVWRGRACQPGQEIDVDEATGAAWLSRGIAEEVQAKGDPGGRDKLLRGGIEKAGRGRRRKALK
jgi:hypothetical protein